MHATASLALLLAAAASAGEAPAPVPPPLPRGLIAVEGKPLRVAALERDGAIELLLLGGRDLELLRLEKRTLVRRGAFRGPARSSRPLLLDASARPGGEALVTAVFGSEVQGVDEGADTRLQAFVLVAERDGRLRAASDDLRAYLRLIDESVYLQRRGPYAAVSGPVHSVAEQEGRFLPTSDAAPWAGRPLLEATPLRGGREALAWQGTRPLVVAIEDGAAVPDGTILEDLGKVEEPRIAVPLEEPIYRMGMDRQGKVLERWHPLARRVLVAKDGAAYTVLRARSSPLIGRTSGQDAVVRLDWSGEHLSLSRPFPGVEAFVIDFALLARTGAPSAAVLLVNEREDGSGRAHLLFQEAR